MMRAAKSPGVSSTRGIVLAVASTLIPFAPGCVRPAFAAPSDSSFATVIATVQPKVVKVYGAGGVRGLEAYQSGLVISAEGHVLTVWSYVLDADAVTVVLNDGRRYEATLVGADPRSEIAVLKVDAADLPFFDTRRASPLDAGARVLAFSNLFGVATGDEAASVLHGHVAARTPLHARRGAYQSAYQGDVFVLDAMTNNPGAAGGVLTDRDGRLAGILGKELRNAQTNTWLNYAIPIAEIQTSIDDILAGRAPSSGPRKESSKPEHPVTLERLGITLVPDVLPKTPPFIDSIRTGSPAAAAGLRPDDLVLFIQDRMAPSCQTVADELSFIDRIDEVRMTVQRDQELIDVVMKVE
ncbi:MAG: serine protease [Planctomycetes bacterium]|nr:serine protease [Planctomycetota bacterium]